MFCSIILFREIEIIHPPVQYGELRQSPTSGTALKQLGPNMGNIFWLVLFHKYSAATTSESHHVFIVGGDRIAFIWFMEAAAFDPLIRFRFPLRRAMHPQK